MRKLLSRLALVGFGLSMAIIVVEIAGRILHLLPSPPSAAYVKLTSQVGVLPEPNLRYHNIQPEFQEWLQFNEMGFRDPKIQFSPKPDQKHILVLGDSYTAGWQVALSQRWTEQIEQLEPSWQLLNLGMPNWGTDQEYLTLLNYPLAKPPDTVLLMIFPGNDIFDNGHGVFKDITDLSRPYFVPTVTPIRSLADLRMIPWSYRNPFDIPNTLSFPNNLKEWVKLNSVTYQLRNRLTMANMSSSRVSGIASPVSVTPLKAGAFERVASPDWIAAWEITAALLTAMKQHTEANGSKLVIALVPYYAIVQPELTPALIKDNPDKYDMLKPSKQFQQFAAENNIPVLDLTDGFIQYYGSQGKALFFTQDKHFNPIGNCVAAVLITNWLDSSVPKDFNRCGVS